METAWVPQEECAAQGYQKATRKRRQPLCDSRAPTGHKGPLAGLAPPDEILAPPAVLHWRQLNHLAVSKITFRVRLGLPMMPTDQLCQNVRPENLCHCPSSSLRRGGPASPAVLQGCYHTWA